MSLVTEASQPAPLNFNGLRRFLQLERNGLSVFLIKIPVKILKFSSRGTLVEYGGKLFLC